MFHGSTHKNHWIFTSIEEVNKLRRKCSEDFAIKNSIHLDDLFTLDEQIIICHYNEQKLFRLCQKFQPPLPYSVIFTAFAYFKRIYLTTSIAQNWPINMLSVCLYLACKVEEYNLSVDKFVMIYPEEERENVADMILGNEMNLMRLLNYQLIIHSPIRALEGFLIDVKTRFPQSNDAESYRDTATEFLNAALFSDVCLLFPPSQLAIAALYVASKATVQDYILSRLTTEELGKDLLAKVNKIVQLVNKKVVYDSDTVKKIQDKLYKVSLQGKANKKRKNLSPGSDKSTKRSKSSALNTEEDGEMDAEVSSNNDV